VKLNLNYIFSKGFPVRKNAKSQYTLIDELSKY
jgi:hypothetical protein